MRLSYVICLVQATLLSTPVSAKQVFAHYMVSGLDSGTNHASTDIQDAMNLGIDAFALNVGAPTADWAKDAIDQLFQAAGTTNGEFKLFFSFDLVAADNMQDHINLWQQYSGNDAYLTYGSDNLPLVSSFGGYNQRDNWSNFKNGNKVALIPNLDDANINDYYTSSSSYLSEYTDIVDGFFSWESAWPAGSDTPSNLSSTWDQSVQSFAHGASKAYMMGLSALQYKDCCGGNYYRIGEANLPQRMAQILDVKPDLTEIITWNDGGESHYIGNLWEEAYTTSPEIVQYANMDSYNHSAWQPLITSFVNAFKAGSSASDMTPPSGDSPIGAFWYHPTLKSCSGSDSISDIGSAEDALNYAVVLPADSQGVSIRVTSGGKQLDETNLNPGLNFASVTGQTSGAQKVELVQNGNTIMTASSPSDVPANPSSCNFNFVVVGLTSN